jgi:glutamine synthetase
MTKYEYVWLDGYQPEPFLRSKVKVTSDQTPPEWSFDGSSTQQADGGSSDCLLIPVQEYTNPLFGDKLVMCGVQTGSREVHPSNTRHAASELLQMNGGLVLNKNIS